MILCLGEGVDEMHHYFNKKVVMMSIGGSLHEMKIDNLNLSGFRIEFTPALHHYTIHNWIALNQENYRTFHELKTMEEARKELERILTGNILSMAKGIGFDVKEPIEVRILGDVASHLVTLKGQRVMAFNLDFGLNMNLPPLIGLGKSSSIGFGMIRTVKALHF
jgi:hypothetical protein